MIPPSCDHHARPWAERDHPALNFALFVLCWLALALAVAASVQWIGGRP